MLETVEALRREGHECVEFAVPEREFLAIHRMLTDRLRQRGAANKPIDHFIQLTSADGNKTLFEPIGYDDPVGYQRVLRLRARC